MISVNVFFADVARDLKYGLHFANVATRELALVKGVENGQAKADVRSYYKKCIHARKMNFYFKK